MKLGVGWHNDVPHEVYHGDGFIRPALSASIAKVLLSRSPQHAYLAHPALGCQVVEQEVNEAKRETLDRGAIIHSLLLGNGE